MDRKYACMVAIMKYMSKRRTEQDPRQDFGKHWTTQYIEKTLTMFIISEKRLTNIFSERNAKKYINHRLMGISLYSHHMGQSHFL